MSSSAPFPNRGSYRPRRNGQYPNNSPPSGHRFSNPAVADVVPGGSTTAARDRQDHAGLQPGEARSNPPNADTTPAFSHPGITSSGNPSHSTYTNTSALPAQRRNGGANNSTSASDQAYNTDPGISCDDESSQTPDITLEGTSKKATRKRKRVGDSSKSGPRKRNTKLSSSLLLDVERFATPDYVELQSLAPIHRFPKGFRLGIEHDTSTHLSTHRCPQTISEDELKELLRSLRHDFPELQAEYFITVQDPKSMDDKINKGFKRNEEPDEDDDDDVPKRDLSGSETDRLYSFNGLNENLKPLNNINDIFRDLSQKALQIGLKDFLQKLGPRKLSFSTLCSGTESPLLAMQMIRDNVRTQGLSFEIDHQFSCEIEDWKQAYIQRNFGPKLLFRDVMELHKAKARTAFGGEEIVPDKPDVTIAGSSCIDYSSLNSHQKEFGDAGESNDTQNATRAYAITHQPSLVILENVLGFPWAKVEQEWQAAGYATKVVRVDSKNFYIPQTRRRGYMLGLRRAVITERNLDLDADIAVEKWAELLEQMQRRASSPFTDFIFADDDPLLQQFKLEAALLPVLGKNSSWEKCRLECLNYRSNHLLGFKRPFTEWQNNGSCNVPDYCDSVWWPQQVERIWETLEINHLRSIVHRHYDMAFKSRPLDMSQSCNYEKDNCRRGVVRCITPTASIYFTYRGGPLVGAEVLALQGLPRDRLILNRETSKQLIDLSGNAMTTTVVGSCIVAALIASSPLFLQQGEGQTEVSDSSMTISEPESLDERVPDGLCEMHLSRGLRSSINITKFREMALWTSRLCLCESLNLRHDQNFEQCRKCGHTSCMTCGRKPKHLYEKIAKSSVQSRMRAILFEEWVRSVFPVRLVTQDLLQPLLAAAPNYSAKLSTAYTEAIEQAVANECRLVSIKRDRGWSIIYESERSRLVLTCRRKWDGRVIRKETFDNPSSAMGVQWEFFAKPNPELPANSPIRKDLSHPIARLVCLGSLVDGEWEVRVPPQGPFTLEVVGSGQRLPCWEQKQGLEDPQFKNRLVWSRLEFRAPASNTQSTATIPQQILGKYELLEDCGTASGSLHVKVGPSMSSNQEPVFLFLDPAPFGNASMDSFVFATEHEKLGLKESREVFAEVDWIWRPSVVSDVATPVECQAQHQWVRVDVGRVVEPPSHVEEVFVAPAETMMTRAIEMPCRTSGLPVIYCQFSMTKDFEQKFDLRSRKSFKLVKDPFALDSLSWLLKRIGTDLQYNEWQNVPSTDGLEDHCITCAPKLPGVVWKAVTVRNADQIRPFENVKEASDYERLLKEAPEAVTAELSYDEQSSLATLKIYFNLPTLIHKVLAARPEPRSGSQLQWTADWRAVVDHDSQYQVLFPTIELQNCLGHIKAQQPPNFSKDLTENQQKSMSWMMEREKSDNKWKEQEVVEAHVPAMGLRLEARVTAHNPVRGGVLADDVGYGKTALVLALIDHDLHHTRPVSPPFREGLDDMIDLKATLILTPKGLPTQWIKEIKKFLGRTYHVLLLTKENFQSTSTIAELRNADIILTTWELFDDSYFAHLARMSKAPNTPFSAGRGFEQWFQMALQDLRTLVKKSNGLQPHSFSAAWQELQMNKYDKFVGLSKRNKKGYQASENVQSKNSSKKSQALLDVEDMEIKQPKGKARETLPLHACKFRRIVVDEFAYLDTAQILVISALQSARRWILSGTPSYNEFNGLNKMAHLLGTTLGRPDGTELRNQKAKSTSTNADRLTACLTSYTSSWHEARYALAKTFAAIFIRKNTAVVQGVRKIVTHEIVRLCAPERIRYQDIQHITANQGVKTGKKVSWGRGTISDEAIELLRASDSPEQALITAASSNQQSSFSSCHDRMNAKMSLITEMLQDIYSELQGAFFILLIVGPDDDVVNVPHIHQFLRSIQQNHFGDGTVVKLLDRIIASARANFKWKVAKLSDSDSGPAKKHADYPLRIDPNNEPRGLSQTGRAHDLKLRAESLTQLTTDLIELVREHRFLAGVDRCLSTQPIRCVYCCKSTTDYNTMLFMGRCGHAVCEECFHDKNRPQQAYDQCPALLCSSQAVESAVINASDLAVALAPASVQHGSKMTALATLLGTITQTEKVVVFAQFGAILSAVKAVLRHFNISFADTTGHTKSVDSAVGDFNNDKQASPKVCLLELDSPNAAGWNLQTANHVVFVCPLVTNTKHAYDAAMTQAVGRVWRLGQLRDVHVHHFMVEKTIEVNVLEGRTGLTVVERGGSVVLVEEAVEGDRALVGAPFSSVACGVGGGCF